MAPTRPRPRVTRALGPLKRTPRQRRLANRDLVIAAAYVQGCSIRLIAVAFGLDPARVREIVDAAGRAAGAGKDSPP